MKDRVPVDPGRVLITPENGAAPYYATMARADNPTQEGTPINKGTLLADATAALFGLDGSAVPDDVFNYLGRYVVTAPKIETGSYVGTGGYWAKDETYTSITLSFIPKLVIVVGVGSYQNPIGLSPLVIPGTGYFPSNYSDSNTYNEVTEFGTTVAWRNIEDNSAGSQYNLEGRTYNYIAFA